MSKKLLISMFLFLLLLLLSFRQSIAKEAVTQNIVVSSHCYSEPYFNQIQQRIAAWWKVSNNANEKSKSPVVSFRLFANGKIDNLHLDQSSGSRFVDAKCMNAIQSMHFDPFPELLKTTSKGEVFIKVISMRTGKNISKYSGFEFSGGRPPIQWDGIISSPNKRDSAKLGGI